MWNMGLKRTNWSTKKSMKRSNSLFHRVLQSIILNREHYLISNRRNAKRYWSWFIVVMMISCVWRKGTLKSVGSRLITSSIVYRAKMAKVLSSEWKWNCLVLEDSLQIIWMILRNRKLIWMKIRMNSIWIGK